MNHSHRLPKNTGRTGRRRGATAVEFAIVAPILFLIFLGSIEIARANQTANATAYAAYQGCRRAIVPGATAANATAAAQSVLTANMIKGATITCNPSTITNATTTVTVQVSVPLSSNGWVVPKFTSGKTINRSCTMTRERTN